MVYVTLRVLRIDYPLWQLRNDVKIHISFEIQSETVPKVFFLRDSALF